MQRNKSDVCTFVFPHFFPTLFEYECVNWWFISRHVLRVTRHHNIALLLNGSGCQTPSPVDTITPLPSILTVFPPLTGAQCGLIVLLLTMSTPATAITPDYTLKPLLNQFHGWRVQCVSGCDRPIPPWQDVIDPLGGGSQWQRVPEPQCQSVTGQVQNQIHITGEWIMHRCTCKACMHNIFIGVLVLVWVFVCVCVFGCLCMCAA